jgi:hypothetical protein
VGTTADDVRFASNGTVTRRLSGEYRRRSAAYAIHGGEEGHLSIHRWRSRVAWRPTMSSTLSCLEHDDDCTPMHDEHEKLLELGQSCTFTSMSPACGSRFVKCRSDGVWMGQFVSTSCAALGVSRDV